MNLCSDNHEEVCFEGRDCPVCDVRDDKDKDIENLKADIKSLEGDVRRLESEAA